MTDDLVPFLRSRLDEDEAAAKAAEGITGWNSPDSRVVMADGFGFHGAHEMSLKEMLERDASLMAFGGVAITDYDADAKFIARFDPARILAEIQAKRTVVTELERCAPLDQNHAGLRYGARATFDEIFHHRIRRGRETAAA